MQFSISVSKDNNCTWFLLSSTQGIATEYPSSLGIYRKINCNNTRQIFYFNEQNGFFLQQLDISTNSWVVGIQSFLIIYSYAFYQTYHPRYHPLRFQVHLIQVANTSDAEFIHIKYKECMDSSSTNNTCEEGWMYRKNNSFETDKTVQLDCNGKLNLKIFLNNTVVI